jgi:hypothetical protein
MSSFAQLKAVASVRNFVAKALPRAATPPPPSSVAPPADIVMPGAHPPGVVAIVLS